MFNNQPTYGDNPKARRRESANQQGNWWIGGYENRPSKFASAGRVQGDGPRGTLTSPSLRITGKHISFLIGGGCDIKTVRAELIVGHKVRYHYCLASQSRCLSVLFFFSLVSLVKNVHGVNLQACQQRKLHISS